MPNKINFSKLIEFVKKERLPLGDLGDIDKHLLDLHSFVVPPTDKLGLAELLIAAVESIAILNRPNFNPDSDFDFNSDVETEEAVDGSDVTDDPVSIQLDFHAYIARAYTDGDYWMLDSLMRIIEEVCSVSASRAYGFDLHAAINTVLGCDYLIGFDS